MEGICQGVLELPRSWSSCSKLPLAISSKPAGKLDTPNMVDRVLGGEHLKVQTDTLISPITGGYRLPGSVNGVDVTLLLDTGATVTLLRHDV